MYHALICVCRYRYTHINLLICIVVGVKEVLLSLSVPNMLCENRQAYMNKILYAHPMIILFNKSN